MSSRFLDISITGDKRLAKKFRKLDRRVQSKTMRNAAKQAMKPVLLTALSRVPRGKTGKLAKNLKIATSRKRDQVGAVVQSGTRRQMGISQSATFYYPAGIEYGTKKIKATIFLRSSLADRRAQAIAILRTQIKKMMANP